MTGLVLYLTCCIWNRRFVDHQEFINWSFTKMRMFWVMFFSVSVGFNLAIAINFELFSFGNLMFLSVILSSVAALVTVFGTNIQSRKRVIRLDTSTVKRHDNTISPEVVYVLRRKRDGILKFGRTSNLENRIKFHQQDYGSKFDIVCCWVVPNSVEYEKLALRMTTSNNYFEVGRKELRLMTEKELNSFILQFTKEVQNGFNQKH